MQTGGDKVYGKIMQWCKNLTPPVVTEVLPIMLYFNISITIVTPPIVTEVLNRNANYTHFLVGL